MIVRKDKLTQAEQLLKKLQEVEVIDETKAYVIGLLMDVAAYLHHCRI